MMGKKKAQEGAAPVYREEPAKPAIYAMLLVVALMAAPLGWLNQKIGREGASHSDVSRYRDLVAAVNGSLKNVQNTLSKEIVDENILKGIKVPTLITPNIAPTNMEEAAENDGVLHIDLTGIYWSKTDPIVTINGENYHVGEIVKGHKIIEIRETEVVFESPMGKKFVKYFYDYLN